MLPLSTESIEVPKTKAQVQVASVGTAVPPTSYSQAEILQAILTNLPLKSETQTLYRRVMQHPSIQTRHFAFNSLTDAFDANLDRIHHRFETEGTKLATQALLAALQQAGVRPIDLDCLIVATCTGYVCPGFASRLIETAGLNPRLHTSDLVGMGCGGALPALQQATHFLSANPGATAAVVCVEICSAAFFSSDDPGIVISNSLFSDGAAAVILREKKNHDAPHDQHGDGPHFYQFESVQIPVWRETLRFKTEGGRLKNVLGAEVPQQAAHAMKKIVPLLLHSQGLAPHEIRHWIIHPGGEKVLRNIQASLNLQDSDLTPSRHVLQKHGNMSSASVLFVLDEVRRSPWIKPGDWGILSSFGAGFSAFAALVRF